jgi:superfamily II DNA helicase RecQ
VALFGGPILQNIPNLGNDALSYNERSLSAFSASSSDTGATDTIYSGNCAADPGILDDIRLMLLEVWNISEPKPWQLKSIYLLAHGRARARRRLLLTRRTGDGKSLVIYGLATLLRGVTIVLVPILALGIDQVSTFWSMAHPEAQVFAEHLDTIRDRDDVVKMATFLQNLRPVDKMRQSIVLWLSPDCLEHTVWKKCISSLLQHDLISAFVCDECHYIPTDGRFFRKQFHTSVRDLVAKLWDNCPMLFCSATFNRPLEHHTSAMLHPAGLGNNNNGLPLLFGLDGDDIVVPAVLNFGLPTPFFTHSIRGTLGRSGIDITISFSSDWKSALKGAVDYIRAGLKVMVYCQSAVLATDKV